MDASKLKAGDVVTVRATVKWADGLYLKLNCSDGSVIAVPHADIVSIEPRPIAVGDTVRLDGIASLDWSVVHVHETRAWIERRDTSGAKFADIVQMSDLTRADASDE